MLKLVHKSLIAGLLSLMIVGVAAPVHAQEKKTDKKAKTEGADKKKSDVYPFNGKIKSSDSAAMTITVAGKEKDRVIHVTSSTRIMKEGKPATFGDAKAGEDIGGQVKKSADGKEEAVSLRFGPRPEGAKKSDKKKEEKK
ncbi:MAG: hypothetical protein AB1705_18435 [Verrucomicrobiota bacterium]